LDLFGTSPQGARLLGNSSTAQHITSGRGSTARASLGALGTARRANVGQKKMRNYCSEILYNVEIIWIILWIYYGFIMEMLWIIWKYYIMWKYYGKKSRNYCSEIFERLWKSHLISSNGFLGLR
jgi:hypothetical protein